jgi:hypothetical protein
MKNKIPAKANILRTKQDFWKHGRIKRMLEKKDFTDKRDEVI